ncbi:phytase [Mucilaginibacter limnophilus]|uniref:Phytase n=1 Tax=Mucilaginibacter limnophilus TaxID=1932778 RepID=A0A3S2VPW9_9SPHI|nr:phytase [Mucilaginibacter limnophilus]RVU02588.1 phytase [Mucilaginibacter limnophilus]
MHKQIIIIISAGAFFLGACINNTSQQQSTVAADSVVKPLYVTEAVKFDSDDPAIWINPTDPAQSLVIGTDKDENGGLYVFDLKGKIIKDKVVHGLKRPNNVDIAYGLLLNGKPVDIAVATERITHKLRIFSLPDMKPVDNGGIPVFEGETGEGFRDLMGIALYISPSKEIYAIVGRKTGPQDGGYLWQYLLTDDGKGNVKAMLKRKFGKYSGKKEIEAIAVDNELGYVYYSDEQFGVRKYYADPSKGDAELAVFAKDGFKEDHEGISIYKTTDSTGYVLVSDQSANQFKVFKREGNNAFVKSIPMSTNNSDGSDVVSVPLNNDFKHGLFVGMSDNRTFQFYRWEDIAGKDIDIRK